MRAIQQHLRVQVRTRTGGGCAVLGNRCRQGSRLLGKIKGQRELTVDDSVLRLLALRQRQLLKALNLRGHAAMHSIKVDTPQDKTWREGKLPDALHKARAHPQWSSLNPHAKLSQAERQEQVEALAARLDEA